MRNTLILLLALFAGTTFAQAPVIDSMLIDESKGILSVYGDFGSAQGKVWCDSVELPVLSWSATLVTATIPDTGKGSVGGVIVESGGLFSNMRIITFWHGKIEHYWRHTYSDGLDDGHQENWDLFWRYDFHSRLINKTVNTIPGIYSTKQSSEERYSWERGGGGSKYRADSLYTWIDFNPDIMAFIFSYAIFEGDKKPYFFIDSTFNTKGGIGESLYAGLTYYSSWTINNNSFLPPQKAIALQNNPSIIAPKDKRSNLGTDDILLKWNTLKYMDAYHIQLSKDSLFNGQRAGQAQQGFTYIVDTIVSSLDFTLQPLEKNTKYYWRVCGVNTEGESRWSEVWSFTTGTSTDVKQERAKSISLTCYPNPAMNELTIVTAEPTRLLLYDVTGKIVKSEQVTSHETKWDVSLLPHGTYILGTSSDQMQVVQIVK